MRIDLEPRPVPSRWLGVAAPVLALVAAMAVGGLVVLLLGKSPIDAFSVYFVQPLSEGWSLQALAVKASPLVMIAVGLSFCFRANLWNIGAEGQFIAGGALGGWLALATHDGAYQGLMGGWWILPSMLALGALGGALYALIPAILRVSLGVSEILSSLMLVYIAGYALDYLVRGPWRDPQGFNFPVSVTFDPEATLPSLIADGRLHAGVLLTLVAVVIAALVLGRTMFGFEVRLFGTAPKAAQFAGFSDRRLTLAVFAISGALAGLAGIIEVSGQINQLQPPSRPVTDSRPSSSPSWGRLAPFGILLAGLVLALTFIGGEGAQVALKLPLDLTSAFQGILLMCVLAADVLTRYRVRLVAGSRPMNPDIVQLVLITIVTAATPLLIAATGELVAERSGILNLGVEGMMIVGAATGFAAAYTTNSTLVGALAGIVAGVLMAALFALLVIGLAANQVASGLALTIFGVGLSGLIGSNFVGQKRDAAAPLHLPLLTDLPVVGRLVFGEDLFVYLAVALVAGVAYLIARTRLGLTLRAVGDNHGSAHVLGVSVRGVRLLAILFGGACAGLAGAYLSLAYTPFWSPGMTAGRGWIALALVVFASWRPWRVMGGALLFGGATVLQLHAQALGIGLPGQLLSAVPYLATVLALVLLSWRNRRGAMAPAMLGTPFVSDR